MSPRGATKAACEFIVMDIPGVALCSVGYTCPCRKASRTSMSFSRVFGTISKSPAWLAFSSSKLRWNAVIAGSIDLR